MAEDLPLTDPREQFPAIRAGLRAQGDAVRAQIVAYLERMASADIGVIRLWPEQPEILRTVAAWIQNRADEKWAAECRALAERQPEGEPPR